MRLRIPRFPLPPIDHRGLGLDPVVLQAHGADVLLDQDPHRLGSLPAFADIPNDVPLEHQPVGRATDTNPRRRPARAVVLDDVLDQTITMSRR